jgi:anti-sigma factor RsiW
MRVLTCEEALGAAARREAGVPLGPDEGAALEAHLARCAACREAVDAQAVVSAVLATRPVSPLPEGFVRRLEARLAAERGWLGLADWRAWTLRFAPVAAAAAVVAMLASALAVGRGAPDAAAPVSLAAVIDAWVAGDRPGGRPAASVLWQSAAADDAVLLTVLTASPEDPIVEPGEAGGR